MRCRHRPRLVALLGVLAVAVTDVISPHAQPSEPAGELMVQPSLSVEDDEATNVSGAACHFKDGKPISCLLVGDEVRYARSFILDDDNLKIGGKVFLLPKKNSAGIKFKETDAEGVAYSEGYYYLIGSHGLNRDGERQASRYFLYRIPVASIDNLAGDLGTEAKVSPEVAATANLDQIMLRTNDLKATAHQKPEDGGNNIEGVAVIGDRIYLGFRGPMRNGKALIGEASLKAVVDGTAPSVVIHEIDLGPGQTVRDLAALSGDLLILSGPQGRDQGEAEVFIWSPKTNDIVAKKLEIAPAATGYGQPEVLMLASDPTEQVKVLVINDGPVNGMPRLYKFDMP